MPIADVLPELSLAIGAIAVLCAAIVVPRHRQGWCASLALMAVATSLIFTVVLHRDTSGDAARVTFSGTWALDGVTALATYTILAATASVIVLSPRWFQRDPRHGEWYVMLILSALGAVLLAGACDLSELLVGSLLSSVTGYTLASYHRRSRMATEAGAKFFLLGAIANPILFLGIVFAYAVASTTRYAGLRVALSDATADPIAVGASAALIFVGLAFKLGSFPAHPWVADVTQGSPAPAAAFLTTVPKIGALAALVRLVSVLPDASIAWRPALAVLAAVTMTLGNLAALWQSDVRRLIGWSSVSQVGYGLMAPVAIGRAPEALPALVVFFVGYTLGNIAALSVVISLRGRTDIRDYVGLGRGRPLHAAALSVAFLSLVGVPPLVGFMAKLLLFEAALGAGYGVLALIAVINTVVSVFYYFRVIATMFLSPAREGERMALLGRGAVVSVATLATLVIGIGLTVEFVVGATSGLVVLPR